MDYKSTQKKTGIVLNIQRFSLHDGPGIRTTVFLKGCPLRCQWCANPESQSPISELIYKKNLCMGCRTCVRVSQTPAVQFSEDKGVVIQRSLIQRELLPLLQKAANSCPTNALELEGKMMSISEVLGEVEKDRPFYARSDGGMTLSGGEPFNQFDFSFALLAEAHHKKIKTCVETCGMVAGGLLLQAAAVLDTILYDIKHYDNDLHKKWTGQGNELILSNLRLLIQNGYDPIVRIPIIPGVNYGERDAEQFGACLRSCGVRHFNLLPYHTLGLAKYDLLDRPYLLNDIRPLNDEDLNSMREIIASYLP